MTNGQVYWQIQGSFAQIIVYSDLNVTFAADVNFLASLFFSFGKSLYLASHIKENMWMNIPYLLSMNHCAHFYWDKYIVTELGAQKQDVLKFKTRSLLLYWQNIFVPLVVNQGFNKNRKAFSELHENSSCNALETVMFQCGKIGRGKSWGFYDCVSTWIPVLQLSN